MAMVEWSLTNEKSDLPAIRTSRPLWSTNGRGRCTKPRMGMLTRTAMAAASGAHTIPATDATAERRSSPRRTLHQHHRTTSTRPSRIPYSPMNSMERSNHDGASLASPLMS